MKNTYSCVYDKNLNSSNSSNGRIYKAKVRSRLTFERFKTDWLIVEEVDETIYFKDKNW